MIVRATILEFVRLGERALVACDVSGGEIRCGTVLEVEGRRDPWRVTGVAMVAADPYRRGRWGFVLVPLRGGRDLAAGDVLRGAADPIPCPCCGSRGLAEAGAYEICAVCGWEDDPVQSAQPDRAGGANRASLDEARAAWAARIAE